MATIKFANGKTVKFNGNPTPQDIEEVAQSLGMGAATAPKEPGIGEKISTGINDFGAGAMEGATFDTNTIDKGGSVVRMPEEPKNIPGSIMRENGSAKQSFSDKYSGVKGAGRLAGGMIPMVAAELMAGAAAPVLALKYGMGPVRAAMNSMGMTMAAYEGMRGAAQEKNPIETAGNMASGYMTGMPLGAASYGVGKAVDWATTKGAEGLANQYLNTAPRVADSLKDKGKPSLGRTFLDETNYGGAMSKDAVRDDMLLRREQNRMVATDKLKQADEIAVKTPATPERGTFEKGALGESVQVSPLPSGPGGGVNLDEMRSSASPVRTEQADIGARNAASSIDDIMGEYGIASGERVVTNERAYQLLGRLDADVNKAYQTTDPNTITPATEARANMANWLRDKLRLNAPAASEAIGKNHWLNMWESSLLPQVSGRAPVKRGGGVVKEAVANALGSRAGLGVARGLDAVATPGTLSNSAAEKVVRPAAKKAGQLGLAEYMERRGNRRGK